MKLCVISSSNGGAFRAFYSLTGIPSSDILIITDRPCGIEEFAKDHGIRHSRLESADNDAFSDLAKRGIDDFGGVDFVFLFFTRLVTSALFDHYKTINCHPSLLPSFQGFQPIRRALQKGVKFFGTTMHIVDKTVDDGHILAQATFPLRGDEEESVVQHVAFLHKVYFMLLVAENFESSHDTRLNFSAWACTDNCNPSLRSEKYRRLYASLEQQQVPDRPAR